jgi:hypothetical protein
VVALLKRHDLPERNVSQRLSNQLSTNGLRRGFTELPIMVDTEGTLSQLTDFLHDFYATGYRVAVDKISLAPVGGESPKLKIQIELLTLTLPKLGRVAHVTYDPLTYAAELAEDSVGPAPCVRAEYDVISDRIRFKPVPMDAGRGMEPETALVPIPVDSREGADKLSVTSAVWFAADPFVYVRDDGKITGPPREVRLNEALDDGNLVLIHRTGVVVRVKENPCDAATLYFYPLGRKFTEREEINAGQNPEIFQLAQAVLHQ